jgi:hypothetical protein
VGRKHRMANGKHKSFKQLAAHPLEPVKSKLG